MPMQLIVTHRPRPIIPTNLLSSVIWIAQKWTSSPFRCNSKSIIKSAICLRASSPFFSQGSAALAASGSSKYACMTSGSILRLMGRRITNSLTCNSGVARIVPPIFQDVLGQMLHVHCPALRYLLSLTYSSQNQSCLSASTPSQCDISNRYYRQLNEVLGCQ